MRRLATTAGIVTAGLLGLTAPAMAGGGWGSTTCSQTPSPACDLGAGSNGNSGQPGANPGQSNNSGRPGGAKPGRGKPGDSGDTIVGDSNLARCSYVKSDYQPPAGAVHTVVYRPAEPGQGPGSWYVWRCTTEGIADALYRPPVWIADGQEPGAVPLPSPAELARMARRQLQLPTPSIAVNPAGDQLVNLPTWMWLTGGWGRASATAAVPGVSVTAVAMPTSVTWVMGDGATVTCAGAGTPYEAGTDPKAPSPDCGHVYRRSSASQPRQTFPITATVHWTVRWSGAGQSGVFPNMTTMGEATFRVAESQALNDNG